MHEIMILSALHVKQTFNVVHVLHFISCTAGTIFEMSQFNEGVHNKMLQGYEDQELTNQG